MYASDCDASAAERGAPPSHGVIISGGGDGLRRPHSLLEPAPVGGRGVVVVVVVGGGVAEGGDEH